MAQEFERLNDRTVNSIAELATKADKAQSKVAIVPIPNDPYGTYLIVKNNGEYDTISPDHVPRSSKLNSVDQVADYIGMAANRWGMQPVVYYNEQLVTLRLNEDDYVPQAGRASVILEHTPEFKKLLAFHQDHDDAFMRQKAFNVLLRIDLCKCIEDDTLEKTVKALAVYESIEASKTTGAVGRNYEGLGKEIKAEMKTTAGELPLQMTLRVKVFTDRALSSYRKIVCKLETDPTNGGSFALIPLADELENAIDQEMQELGELLRATINGSNAPRLTGPSVSLSASDSNEDSAAAAPASRPFVPVFYGSF